MSATLLRVYLEHIRVSFTPALDRTVKKSGSSTVCCQREKPEHEHQGTIGHMHA